MFVASDDKRLFYVQQHADIVVIKWTILDRSHLKIMFKTNIKPITSFGVVTKDTQT